MHDFTPILALIGGLLIGLSAVLLLWLDGRVAGVSGIAAGLVTRGAPGPKAWRVLFLVGLVVGTAGAAAFGLPVAVLRLDFPRPLLLLAGVLVGYGTALAGGCTSGHGICGLARLSPRSLVAVLVFLAWGMATTFVTRHLLGLAA